VPPGLGSYAQWDRRLDGRLAMAVMSIQAVKGVGIGLGFEAACRKGSAVHDGIFYTRKNGFFRKTNNAGGIEGGMTNGEDIVIRAAMKPIATLKKPLASVNIASKRPARASVERSDVCAVPAAGVIGENVAAIEIANALIEKVGGDSLGEMRRNYEGYLEQLREF
jgi:chorismate synthase